MADALLSDLTAITSVSTGDLLYVLSGGADFKATAAQLAAYVTSTLGTLATQDAGAVAITGGTIAGDGSGLTGLTGAQITGNITGDAASITGSITTGQVTGLDTALAAKADDSTVVHATGDETVAGIKTFSSTIAGSVSGNAATATNGVVTTGSYADPAWITSLAGTKVSGDIAGNAVSITGSISTAQVTGLDAALAATLAAANNLSDLADAATARTNLGLAIGTDVLAPTGNGSGLTSLNPLAIDHTWSQFTVAGGAATIDWSVSDRWYGTLASGVNTLTYTNVPAAGKNRVLMLRITQPASGSAGTVSWPTGSLRPGGTDPALSAANGAIDVVNVSLAPDGSSYDTFLAGGGLA